MTREPRWRFHWQNLNEDRDGNVKGWPWHGRAWLTIGKLELRWSWNLWTHFCGLSVTAREQEDGTTFHLGFPPIAFWFSFAWKPWRYGYDSQREISVQVFDSAIWWHLWTNPDSWSSKTPKWREGNWRPADTFLGKSKYSERILSTHRVTIPMPEGGYPATVELREDTWKRSRWFARKLRRCNVNVPQGIPHQGKGENSWDCGEDRLFGMGCVADTVEKAISATVESALRSRRRYDGNVMATYPAPAAEAGGAP